MSNGFGITNYPFNAVRSVPAYSALGIFPASSYSSTYGTGGDDTAAIQAAINAAASFPGGVAYLPPPSSGYLNVSRTPDGLAQSLYLPANTWLVGANPQVTIRVIAGSNVDWILANGTHNVTDYRTNFVVNYRNITVGGNPYTCWDPTRPSYLTSGGGIANINFLGETSPTSGLVFGVMLNAANNFSFQNVSGQTAGELFSLWDCSDVVAYNMNGTSSSDVLTIHRACYDIGIVGSFGNNCQFASYLAQTEQYQVPNGPLLTLSPIFLKFVETHHYSGTSLPAGVALGGVANANLNSCTGDNVTITSAPYNGYTRFGVVNTNILVDGASGSGVASVTGGTGITIGGTATNPVVNLTTPVSVANGGTGSGTQNFVDLTTNQTVGGTKTFSTPIAKASGGTGLTSPSLVPGTNVTITGSWPNQTINASTGGFPFTIVQQAVVQGAGSVTSLTLTFPKTATAGNTILLFFAYYNGETFTFPSGYTNVVTEQYSGTVSVAAYKKTAAGTETSATFTYTGGTSTGLNMGMIELGGARTVDQSATLGLATIPSGGGTFPTITPTAGSAIFCAASANTNATDQLPKYGAPGWDPMFALDQFFSLYIFVYRAASSGTLPNLPSFQPGATSAGGYAAVTFSLL